MKIFNFMKDHILYLDGGLGTLLQARGLRPGEYPERWNLTHPEVVCQLHRDYFDAGSNVVCTNTFGANRLKFSDDALEEIIKAAMDNALRAKNTSAGKQEKFVALDIGPTGRLLKPYGDLDFEDAVDIFAQIVRLGQRFGADLIMIETMNDSYETKAALLAAKENSALPVFVSNAYGEDGKLMTGASPAAMAAMLEGMGADAIGANCSLGPMQLRRVMEQLLQCTRLPVLLKPNAGLPRSDAGHTVYDIAPEEFAQEMRRQLLLGIRIAGGCCGTTPAYIRELVQTTQDLRPIARTVPSVTRISSYTHAVEFGPDPILIGERINPTGKKRLKRALLENDMEYILQEGLSQQERGVQVLDVNVGLPDLDEPAVLQNVLCEMQAVIDLPLQIDTANPVAMEAALRRYNGKALINSVSGKAESMRAIFPLMRKYGGVAIALTLDENGIPDTPQGRVEIARRILKTAAEYGISQQDIVFDTLAMAVSADAHAAVVTLQSLNQIRRELGCHTSLGVSNVSFGLPDRAAINHTFFAAALENGLSAAIMNPYSDEMLKTYYAYRALHGLDENCADYIAFSARCVPESTPAAQPVSRADSASSLQRAIAKGLKEAAAEATRMLLASTAPLDIIQNEIIPALDAVGKGFEEKTVFLPQLLMSAEAAKAAFEIVKSGMPMNAANSSNMCGFVLATVHGDIHDIGKNIVRLLLENYGFRVYDLGKDVPPERIVQAVLDTGAPLVGLSALMTTTVPAMEETIRQLRAAAPQCKIVVGGAVLNQEYADRIGADKYAQNAMETVRYATLNSETR